MQPFKWILHIVRELRYNTETTGRSSVGRAHGWGSCGRTFKSCRPDKILIIKNHVHASTGPKINKLPYYFVLPILLLFVFIVVFLLTWKNNKLEPISNTKQQIQISPQAETKEVWLGYFISDYLSLYPAFQAKFKPASIKNAFPIDFKTSKIRGRGWLVEVQEESTFISHYLLTPTIEKKLVDTMSCNSQDENPPIELEKVEIVDLNRGLGEENGYLVLSGTNNRCYGGGSFVSVYNMYTGEKIKLQGDFAQPGSVWRGVSITGNALGILRGVYGSTEPTIVVEYDLSEYKANGAVAYFDLQTGELKNLITFQ